MIFAHVLNLPLTERCTHVGASVVLSHVLHPKRSARAAMAKSSPLCLKTAMLSFLGASKLQKALIQVTITL